MLEQLTRIADAAMLAAESVQFGVGAVVVIVAAWLFARFFGFIE